MIDSTVAFARHAALATVSVEALVSFDAQGKGVYAAPVVLSARVSWKARAVLATDGTKLRADVTLWMPSTISYVAKAQDRITLTTGERLLVIDSYQVRDSQGRFMHLRLGATRS